VCSFISQKASRVSFISFALIKQINEELTKLSEAQECKEA